VESYVRLAPRPEDLHAVRVAAGSADVLLGCDVVVAASPAALSRVQAGATKAVINSHVQPTAAFLFNPDIDFAAATMLQAIKNAAGDADIVDATGLATALMGDSIAANLFMLGYAVQKGLVPLSVDAIERAIELNGVAVEANKRTLAWGRLAAHDRAQVEALTRPQQREDVAPRGIAALVERCAAVLTDYQDAAYARRYRDTVATIETAESTRARGCSGLTEAVARNLFKLMAYKDEYEVARLYTDGAFLQKLHRQFEGDFKLRYHLAPPILAVRDPASGELRKRAFGGWMRHVFGLLARLRRLRGTAFDIFGYTRERGMERQLIADYEVLLREIVTVLSPDNHPLAVEIAALPEQIRGFGHIKQCNVERVKAREAELLAMLRSAKAAASAA
jgi:indolepyruvate ferredoxin oxidoreductase